VARSKAEDLLPVEDALRLVLAEAAPLGDEEIDLASAFGRVLAETLAAPEDMPAFARSAMDGFAVRAADVAKAPVLLEVVGFLPAGRDAAGIEVGPGRAVRIMTGAPLPAGADAVVMVERTQPVDPGDGGGTAPPPARVRILAPVAPGENVTPRGADLVRGDVVLEKGARIRAAELGALAGVGRTRPRVHRRPSAFVLSTGDEIVDPASSPLPHQVRNSNSPALVALLEEAGARPTGLGIAGDDPAVLDARIAQGLSGDLLFLIGGVSVGDKDLVSDRLTAAGVRVLFHRIAMKPGKPLLFGRRGSCLVFGLPGNPLSALTAFLLFGLPAVRRAAGLAGAGLPEVRARVTETVRQKPGRTWYRLARIALRDGFFHATPVRSSGSGDMVSASRANGFIVIPADSQGLEAGTEARALLWPGFGIE
jgi:molybdopterin molybdotransferase